MLPVLNFITPAAESALDLAPVALGGGADLYRVTLRTADAQSDRTVRGARVFVELEAPGGAGEVEPWLEWQAAAIASGGATFRLVVRRNLWGNVDWAALAPVLARTVAHTGRDATLVLRFDAAPLALALPAMIAAHFHDLIVGPVALWPWPIVGDAREGSHPLRALYSTFGLSWADWLCVWRDAARLAAAPATNWAAHSWRWQESAARAPVPVDPVGQWAAALFGTPLVAGGIASFIADDWAVRRTIASEPLPAHPLPIQVVFSAIETADNASRALDYVFDIFGDVYPDASVAFTVDDLPGASETNRTEELTRTPETLPKSTPVRAARRDDLTIIEGIGPKIARILSRAGITTFAALAAIKASELQKLLDAAGPRFALANPGTWPRQATLLARGDTAAFQRLTEELRGGVRA